VIRDAADRADPLQEERMHLTLLPQPHNELHAVCMMASHKHSVAQAAYDELHARGLEHHLELMQAKKADLDARRAELEELEPQELAAFQAQKAHENTPKKERQSSLSALESPSASEAAARSSAAALNGATPFSPQPMKAFSPQQQDMSGSDLGGLTGAGSKEDLVALRAELSAAEARLLELATTPEGE